MKHGQNVSSAQYEAMFESVSIWVKKRSPGEVLDNWFFVNSGEHFRTIMAFLYFLKGQISKWISSMLNNSKVPEIKMFQIKVNNFKTKVSSKASKVLSVHCM